MHLKKNLFLLLILATALLFPTAAFAQSQFNQNKNALLPKDQTVTGDYFTTGESVNVLGTVTGDLYAAGGNITIDGQVQGDVLAAGGSVMIRGPVAGNVRVAGGTVTISSQIAGSITVAGGTVIVSDTASVGRSIVGGVGNISIYGPVAKGITVGGGTVLIDNTVGSDVNAGAGRLTLNPKANVSGNVTYISEEQVLVQPGATVSGQINRQQHPVTESNRENIADGFGAALAGLSSILKLASILTTLAIGFLLLKLVPQLMEQASQTVVNKRMTNGLLGLVTIVITPIVIAVLAITIVGLPLAFILFCAFVLLLFFGKLVALYAIGRHIMVYFGKTEATYLAFFVGLLLYELIQLIPLIGGIAKIAIYSLAVGALLLSKYDYYNKP